MSFATPLALAGLALVPLVLAGYLFHQWRRTRYAERFARRALLPGVIDRAPGWRRHVPFALFLLALSTLLVGVARPHAIVSTPREEATVILALDVSGSMGAKDVAPTRLAAARAAARVFLEQVPEKFRVGIVSFADRAQVALPPTQNREAARDALAALSLGEGTAIGDAITLTLDLGRGLRAGQPADEAPPVAVLLLSDGAQTVGRLTPAAAAARARALRIPVYTVALGTDAGVVERELLGGYREIIRVPPDPETLRRVATATRAEFFSAPDSEQLAQVYEELGSRLGERRESREVSDLFAAAGGGLLLVGGALSALWFRRLP